MWLAVLNFLQLSIVQELLKHKVNWAPICGVCSINILANSFPVVLWSKLKRQEKSPRLSSFSPLQTTQKYIFQKRISSLLKFTFWRKDKGVCCGVCPVRRFTRLRWVQGSKNLLFTSMLCVKSSPFCFLDLNDFPVVLTLLYLCVWTRSVESTCQDAFWNKTRHQKKYWV